MSGSREIKKRNIGAIEPKTTPKSSSFRKWVGITLLAGGLILTPSLAKTETNEKTDKPTTIVQVDPKLLSKAVGSAVIGQELPPITETISVMELKELEKLNGVYSQIPTYDEQTGRFGISTKVPVPGENYSFVVLAVLNSETAKSTDHLAIPIYVDKNGKEEKGFIDLQPLVDLYYNATGKELKYVKLVAENGYDDNVGAYVQVYIVPVDKLNGEIKSGVPVCTTSYTPGILFKPVYLSTE